MAERNAIKTGSMCYKWKNFLKALHIRSYDILFIEYFQTFGTIKIGHLEKSSFTRESCLNLKRRSKKSTH